MAIFSLNTRHVMRSKGQSSVKTAAYLVGEKLYDSRLGKEVHYKTQMNRPVYYSIVGSELIPSSLVNLEIWDKMELFEDKYALKTFKTLATQERHLQSARTSQVLMAALPVELSLKEWKSLVLEFTQEWYLKKNLISLIAIYHHEKHNPYVQIQTTLRSIDSQGIFSSAKVRDINGPPAIRESRRLWAEKTNFYLQQAGVESFIDHRSHKSRGLSVEPTIHEGRYHSQRRKKGQNSRLIALNDKIKNSVTV